MKHLLAVIFCLLSVCQTKGQIDQSAMNAFNKFQDFTNGKPMSADSAFYVAQQASSNAQLLRMMNGFMQMSFPRFFTTGDERSKKDTRYADFLERFRPAHQELLVKMMKDNTGPFHDLVMPMYYWAEVEKNKEDKAKVTELTNRYLSQGLLTDDLFSSRSLRYGLLIYQAIVRQPDLQPLASDLFGRIESKLESLQIPASESLSYGDLEKRAHYRYLYAYLNFLAAQAATDNRGKEARLKAAFDYSPDLLDKSHDSVFLYDMVFLDPKEEKQSFQDYYLNFLLTNGASKEKTLPVLTKIALDAPERKNQLRAYYEANDQSGKSFGKYWADAVNDIARTAPPISLVLLDGKKITSRHLVGQWVLVDFWGTWCAPCREEHPALQKFYESTVNQNPEKISVLTVACNDEEKKVAAYMEQKKYSFPVAMADDDIQRDYAVNSWPTKLLITPAGRYITIPFHADWVEFIKEYSGL